MHIDNPDIALRIGKGHLGQKRSTEQCALMALTWAGRKHSEETKLKISKSKTGVTHSDASKAKFSASHKGFKMYNNGIINKWFKLGDEPNGFTLGTKKGGVSLQRL